MPLAKTVTVNVPPMMRKRMFEPLYRVVWSPRLCVESAPLTIGPVPSFGFGSLIVT